MVPPYANHVIMLTIVCVPATDTADVRHDASQYYTVVRRNFKMIVR